MRPQLNKNGTHGAIRSHSVEVELDGVCNSTVLGVADWNGNRCASSGSDATMSTSESSFEELQTKDRIQHRMSELKLQIFLKEERDALKGEGKQFKASQRHKDGSKVRTPLLLFDAANNSQAIVEELKQELNHANEINKNLRIQLQKTQESNSELILAVQDLEDMLERKSGREMSKQVQCECSNELENLEKELKRQTKQFADALVAIREHKARAMSLEEELEKRTKGFDADLEKITRSKFEQEQRATRAEESLNKLHLKNAETVEKLEEEFRKLWLQMESTFEANENLTTKSMVEADELRSQKYHLEEMLEKISQESVAVERRYEAMVHELTCQVTLLTNQMEQMKLEIEEKRHFDESQKLLSDEILVLREEIEMHIAKNSVLVEEMGRKETLVHKLEDQVMLMKKEGEEMCKDLNGTRCLVEEKESIVGKLKSEDEKLRKQVYQLTCDLKKRDNALKSTINKKIKDGDGQANPATEKVTPRVSKSIPHGLKEVESLKERVKLLESQIKLKEIALKTSANTFLRKEKKFHDKIAELEESFQVLNKRGDTSNVVDMDGLRNEMALMKERNTSMEGELKEMQERYLEISLKFAEVEGERQQLVMELRNLKNSNKSL